MGASQQEVLLDERIRRLDALEREAATLDARVGLDKKDKQKLLEDLSSQRKVLEREQAIRSQYRAQAEALAQLKQHEELKSRLRAAQAQRPLTAAEVASYRQSRARCSSVLQAAGVPAADPLDTQAAPAQLHEKRARLQQEYLDLKKANVELFSDASGIASPATACLAGRLQVLRRNIAHKQRAARSMQYSARQKNKDTCALMSARSVMMEVAGKAPPEGSIVPVPTTNQDVKPGWESVAKPETNDMVAIGCRSRAGNGKQAYRPCNGTIDEAAVLSAAGIPAKLKRNPSLDDIATALDEGRAVNVAYDARPVWYGTTDEAKKKWPPNELGHTVRVTAVDRNGDGSVRGFYINDSGDGKAGRYVDAKTFQTALGNFGGGRAAISETAIQPPI